MASIVVFLGIAIGGYGDADSPTIGLPVYHDVPVADRPSWSIVLWLAAPRLAYSIDFIRGAATATNTLYLFGDPDAVVNHALESEFRYNKLGMVVFVNNEGAVLRLTAIKQSGP